MSSQAHLFALYVPQLNYLIENKELTVGSSIKDPDLWGRIVRILRLRGGEQIVFFDQTHHVRITLDAKTIQSKNVVYFSDAKIRPNVTFSPQIILAMGLTKPDAFEEIAALCVRLGAHSCIPVLTSKVQRKWGAGKELERLHKIMVAAAEQSKNYSLPCIENPQSLTDFIVQTKATKNKKVFFELGGKPLSSLLSNLTGQGYEQIVIVVGPEGGLTELEQEQLELAGFEKYHLTPTVLRSVEAVAVGMGSIRSVAKSF